MRIISGKFKGRILNPPLARWNTRPTMDFTREALFNILENKMDLTTVKVLDLFGGTGSVSFEFVSRGCQSIVYVDINPACLRYVEAEKKMFGISGELRLVRDDALRFLNRQVEKFDIVFCDPPYDYLHYEAVYNLIFEKNVLNTDGMLILEHNNKKHFNHLPYFVQLRKYGASYFSFFEYRIP